jgi:Fur family peroxide stress response transcriptional regulator
MTKLATFLHALQQAGCRLTPQRRAICEYLAATNKHPTPYAVYRDITQHHPEISRATVYNTLNILHNLGVIVEISFGDDHTHYETDLSPHVNLICMRCHQIIDYPGQLLMNETTEPMLAATGFQPTAAKVEILGLCAACQTQQPVAAPTPAHPTCQ